MMLMIVNGRLGGPRSRSRFQGSPGVLELQTAAASSPPSGRRFLRGLGNSKSDHLAENFA